MLFIAHFTFLQELHDAILYNILLGDMDVIVIIPSEILGINGI